MLVKRCRVKVAGTCGLEGGARAREHKHSHKEYEHVSYPFSCSLPTLESSSLQSRIGEPFLCNSVASTFFLGGTNAAEGGLFFDVLSMDRLRLLNDLEMLTACDSLSWVEALLFVLLTSVSFTVANDV